MRQFVARRRAVVALSVVAVLAVAAAAIAYFTSTGSGTGSGAVGSATNYTVTPNAFTGGPLFPGNGSEASTGTVTNGGSGTQHLNTLTATIAAPTVAAGAPTGDPAHPCSAADFTLSSATWSVAANGQSATLTVGTDLAPNNTFTWSGLSISMLNAVYNQDNCQGATANITFTAG
jgi:hypothetical protein